jgi:CRP-like cAMP-binding protein
VVRRELVSKVAFLEGADETFIADLAGSMVERVVARGETLFQQGDAGDAFWILRSGKLRVERDGERIGVLGRGDWVGEGALLGSSPRSASVLVVEDSVLFEMSRDAFRYMLDQHPRMAQRIGEIHEERRMVELEAGLQKSLLEGVPLLAGAAPGSLELLVASLETRRVDGVVFEEGSAGDEFFLIGTGSVSVVRGEAVIATLPEGHYFGEGALLSGQPRSASVVTNGAAVFYVLERDEFHRLLETDARLGEQIESAHSFRVSQAKPTQVGARGS